MRQSRLIAELTLPQKWVCRWTYSGNRSFQSFARVLRCGLAFTVDGSGCGCIRLILVMHVSLGFVLHG